MELHALRTFVAVAEAASFTRAAEVLHLTQPVVSQHVKRLERDLGAQVLDRSTRRVQLTPAGARLLPHARTILAEVARAENETKMVGAGVAGRVAIGFVGTATYDLLPGVTRSVRKSLPNIELEVFGEELNPSLIDGLRSRRLDIAVMRQAAPDASVFMRPLRSEALIAALPADHPAAHRAKIPLTALSEDTFVTHPSGHRSVMYEAVVQACRGVGFLPKEVIEVRETATLVAYVAAGIGVSLVPEPVRSLSLEGVAFRALDDIQAHIDLVIATRAGLAPTTVVHVVEAVAAVARQWKGTAASSVATT